MAWTILCIIVIAATAIWPLGRWTLKNSGEPGVVGFWVSLTVTLLCGAGTTATGDWLGAPAGVCVAGAVFGIAYAVGFWICTMRALQIGPAGPTATINNMAMAAGVLYGLLVLTPGRATAWTWAGLAGVCAALLLLGLGKPASDGVHRTTGACWARLVAIGGGFSCLSFMVQAHVGTLYPTHKYVFGVAGLGTATVLLLPPMLRDRSRFARRRECVGGVTLGAVNGAILPLTMITIRQLGAEVVLPVAVATPILLVLLIGRVFYGEHLSVAAWIGCVLGALAVAALVFSTAS
jgi:drug/metabolite transporter (DMT)-like permease